MTHRARTRPAAGLVGTLLWLASVAAPADPRALAGDPAALEQRVGREILVRGLVTSLRDDGLTLSAAALVTDPAGLAPSPLAQQPLGRKPLLLQHVTRAPGAGLADLDLAAVVIHGESDHSNGTRWREDVRFLLKDGTAYRRTEMPPDPLDVAASRRLEPQQWGRWRQDVYFSRSSFDGSLALGGVSSTHAIRFTRDGRFERSGHAFGASGGMAAMNGAAISASSRADGSGSLVRSDR